MKKLLNKYKENFIDYMCRTIKNKILALIFVVIGNCSLLIDQDGTFLALTVLIGLALFFVNDDIFEME